jgi:hypothetical protein
MMSLPNLRWSVDRNNMKECCHGIIWRAMWIGKYVTGIFHQQFEVKFGLEQMIKDDVMNKFEKICV